MRLRNRLSLMAALASVSLAGCVATVPPEEDPVLIKLTELERRLAKVEGTLQNESLLQIMSQIQTLQEEMRELRGGVETADHELEGVRDRQRDLYVELDRRLASLERGGAPATSAPPTAAPGSDSGPPAGGAAGSGNEEALYDRAISLLREGRYGEAEQIFTQLLEEYPAGRYADNAQYWLAETFYVRREFARALPLFQQVIEQHPRSSKVPDALLKVGFSHYELSQWQPARSALERLVERYPESSAARVAGDRLERMSREGH